MSTTFFSFYLNDLSKCFNYQCDPVPLGNCGLHISCLMYADDIVLLSKSAKVLQTLLCRLEDVCNKWNLKVNINKTKIIIFNKAGRVPKGHNFTYGNILLEHVNEYKYLGIYFMSSDIFTQGIKYL